MGLGRVWVGLGYGSVDHDWMGYSWLVWTCDLVCPWSDGNFRRIDVMDFLSEWSISVFVSETPFSCALLDSVHLSESGLFLKRQSRCTRLSSGKDSDSIDPAKDCRYLVYKEG